MATPAAAVDTVAEVGASRPSLFPGGLRVSMAEGGGAEHVDRGWVGYGRSSFRAVIQKVMQSWAARSLQVGALATVVDICVLLVCKKVLKLPTPVGAAIGVAVGSTLAFFLNRSFAFRATGTPVAGQAVKFIISTLIAMSIHAPLVGILADWLDVPVVVAKLIADILVFSIGQLLVLRFLIFKKTHGTGQPPPAASS
ncbi:MAG TPA: GtrA family protein [Myxococcaceae bacterium]